METNRKGFSLTARILIVLLAAVAAIMLMERFKKERAFAIQNACISNLRILDGANEQAAIELGIRKGHPITPEQVSHCIPGGFSFLKCRAGGVYTINPHGTPPTCNIPGHNLPEQMTFLSKAKNSYGLLEQRGRSAHDLEFGACELR